MKRKTFESRGFIIAIVIFSLLILVKGLTAVPQPQPSQKEDNQKERGSEMAPHRIPMLDQKMKVDGVLDEEAWKNALKLVLKYEVQPGENIPAPVHTEVLLYTTKTLFPAETLHHILFVPFCLQNLIISFDTNSNSFIDISGCKGKETILDATFSVTGRSPFFIPRYS